MASEAMFRTINALTAEYRARIAALEAELAEHVHLFDMRWKAGQRAIKRWQETTGRGNTWPNHTDLLVYLMEKLEAAEAELAEARKALVPSNSRMGPAALEWFNARNECIAAAIGDPEYRRKLNRLSEAEDALAAAFREEPTTGVWPDWGNRPDGFDGPTGAE